jgi:hypothetical protein
MSGAAADRNVRGVSLRQQTPSDRPAWIVVAGGGAAGLETLIALRAPAGPTRVSG